MQVISSCSARESGTRGRRYADGSTGGVVRRHSSRVWGYFVGGRKLRTSQVKGASATQIQKERMFLKPPPSSLRWPLVRFRGN